MNRDDLFGDEDKSDNALIQAYTDEYARNEDDWKSIENKAQGTIAVAAIFVGFGLNYLSDIPSGLSVPMRVLFVAVLVLLVVSIVSALLALHVRAYSTPPLGTF